MPVRVRHLQAVLRYDAGRWPGNNDQAWTDFYGTAKPQYNSYKAVSTTDPLNN